MQPKIKKHYSLFMVSKTIRKPSKKQADNAFEILIQGQSKANFFENFQVPRFLDPINCYHLFGDMCFAKADYNEGEEYVGLLSNYNHFKRVVTIGVNSSFISLTLEQTNDHIHSWEFLCSRLNTLNNRYARELVETMQSIQNYPSKIQVTDRKAPQKQDYNAFCKEIDSFCKENPDIFYTLFRFRLDNPEKGLELTEIRHSRRTVQFFADDMETFAHLVLEQGLLNIWVVDEKNYFTYMSEVLSSIYCQSKVIPKYASTMEGYKVYIAPIPLRKIFRNDAMTEIVCIATYEIEESQLDLIRMKREEAKKKIKKSFRERQLEQTLQIYYKSIQKEKGHRNVKHSIEEGFEDNNVFLAEKKRCGIKFIN